MHIDLDLFVSTLTHTHKDTHISMHMCILDAVTATRPSSSASPRQRSRVGPRLPSAINPSEGPGSPLHFWRRTHFMIFFTHRRFKDFSLLCFFRGKTIKRRRWEKWGWREFCSLLDLSLEKALPSAQIIRGEYLQMSTANINPFIQVAPSLPPLCISACLFARTWHFRRQNCVAEIS